MNKTLYLLALICLFIFGCKSSNKDQLSRRLSKTAVERDLSIFTEILEKEHPSLYLYISPDRLKKMINDIRSSSSDGITFQEFYNKLSLVINEIGCSHTDIDIPDDIYDSLNKRKYFFPYPVLWIDHRLIVNAVGYDLPEGTEIKKVNGEPVRVIMDNLMTYNPVEGNHRNVQKELAADRFAIEYFFKYGKQNNFDLEVIDTTGRFKLQKEKPITLSETYQRKNNDRYYYDRTDVNYDFHIKSDPNLHCAYMAVHTFSFEGQQKQEAYENFCYYSFQLLSYRKDIKNLIIDLRENSGGSLYNAFVLFSYLSKGSYKEFEAAATRVNKVYYPEYLDLSYMDTNTDTINNRMKSWFTNRVNKDYYLMTDSLIETWEPFKFHFDGNIYVITNRKVMSAASYFATLVKNSGVGKLVGAETSGGSSSGNAYTTLYYSLPESGIRLYFPYAHIVYSYKDKINTG